MNTSHPASRPVQLSDLQARIAASAYVVDPVLVAAALLRRSGLGLLGVSARSPTA